MLCCDTTTTTTPRSREPYLLRAVRDGEDLLGVAGGRGEERGRLPPHHVLTDLGWKGEKQKHQLRRA